MGAAPLTAPIAELVVSRLRDIPDFPVPGVTFKDFTPLLSDGPALRAVVQDISAGTPVWSTSSSASRRAV
jgi:hypothetical protein